MVVLKFGGTSVSSKKSLEQIRSILAAKKDNFIVVVSAFSNVTNKLEEIVQNALINDSIRIIEEFKGLHLTFINELILIDHQPKLIEHLELKCNELETICKGVNILKELSEKTKAQALSIGEQLSSLIVHQFLNQEKLRWPLFFHPWNLVQMRSLFCRRL